MQYINLIITYLKGTASHLGTTKNLIREIILAVCTAVGTYLVLHVAMPPEPNVVGDLRDVIQTTVKSQQRADSLQAWILIDEKQDTIDSLQFKIRQYEERDSLRANGELSPLEAMRTIIGAIKGKSTR